MQDDVSRSPQIPYKCLPIFSNICMNIVGTCSPQISYKCFPMFSNICMKIVGTKSPIYNSDGPFFFFFLNQY